ncbi:hypothetical protein GX48_08034 [Paracoccidioides brasiliensis]|nr:hypothetical protein GX48_08034 [Paracoccidioides brasiliensis]
MLYDILYGRAERVCVVKSKNVNLRARAYSQRAKSRGKRALMFLESPKTHPEPELSSYYCLKRPRVDKDKLIEHWVSKYEWPKGPSEVDAMGDLLVRQGEVECLLK